MDTKQEKDELLQKIENDGGRNIDTRVYVDDRFSIAEKLYSAITEDSFDVNIDLSEYDSLALSSFYYDLAGFNIIANKDKFEEYYDDDTIMDVINGKFKLREYSYLEGSILAVKYAKEGRIPKGCNQMFSFDYVLKTIQDGKYYFNKMSDPKISKYESVLVTDPPKFYFDGVEQKIVDDNFEGGFYTPNTVSAKTLLQRFRNLIAHSAEMNFDALDGTIHFKNDKFEFVCTKMWLRGFSTFWSARNKRLDSDTIKSKILEVYGENKKSIKDQNDIRDILKLVNKEINYNTQTASSTFKFVINRLKYYTDYYGLKTPDGKEDFDKKIDIFINIIANNPNHTTINKEFLNSKILYNIQQIIGTSQMKIDNRKGELLSRSFNLEVAGAKLEELADLNKEMKKISEKKEQFVKNIQAMKPAQKMNYMKGFMFKRELKQIDADWKRIKDLQSRKVSEIEDLLAHEAKDMDLFNKDSIKDLPIEVAVNLIGYMGYNRFISSGFYQNVLTDGVKLDKAQQKAIMSLDLSGFSMKSGDRKMPLDNLDNRLVFLRRIRHTTSHGLISYIIPQNSTEKSSISDVQITYAEADLNKVKVTGKIGDYFKLFKNDFFSPVSDFKRASNDKVK